MQKMFTSGYQGENINQFVDKIQFNKITALIDIRENPYSRKPGFSQKALQLALSKVGIKYNHYVELGTPRPLRDFLIKSNDFENFHKLYRDYVSEFKESLIDLIFLSKRENICILCFEKDPHLCHRKVIVDLISEYTNKQINIIHI